jgi:hypothetical protein
MPQSNAQASYYSNNFDSSSALRDGYWSLHDASIQTVNNINVLVVDGEATFLPGHGDFAPDNFTVQFDVYQNLRYEKILKNFTDSSNVNVILLINLLLKIYLFLQCSIMINSQITPTINIFIFHKTFIRYIKCRN